MTKITIQEMVDAADGDESLLVDILDKHRVDNACGGAIDEGISQLVIFSKSGVVYRWDSDGLEEVTDDDEKDALREKARQKGYI